MKTNGIHGAVSSQAFKRLKTIVDTQSMEKLTCFYVREFDETTDSIVRNNTIHILNKETENKQDANRPFFTDTNGKAMQAVKRMQEEGLEPER